jgi:FkbM family methyltransferase
MKNSETDITDADNNNIKCLFSQVFNQKIKGKSDYIYNNSVITNELIDFEVCKTILEYATPDSDIIDIGANIGLVTLGMKRLLELNNATNYVNKFHCFECNDDTFSYLKYNTLTHNDIILYNFGLSDAPQIANMEINSYNYGCNMIKEIYDNSNNSVEILEYEYQKIYNPLTKTEHKMFISLMPLDLFYNAFEKKISAIKIDVEGMEYKVLLGAKILIEKHKPAIVVEIFDDNIVKVNDLMKSYNYINRGLIPKKYISQDYLFTYSGGDH